MALKTGLLEQPFLYFISIKDTELFIQKYRSFKEHLFLASGCPNNWCSVCNVNECSNRWNFITNSKRRHSFTPFYIFVFCYWKVCFMSFKAVDFYIYVNQIKQNFLIKNFLNGF